ncbi:MAG: DUF3078 domain-containing protein [Saprospiraceae bacterium]|nr:DUF3078 domain-containing protein [Saprospiraceae bacterium]
MNTLCRQLTWAALLSAFLFWPNLNHARIETLSHADSSQWNVTPEFGFFFSQQSYSEYHKGGGLSSLALSQEIGLRNDYSNRNLHFENEFSIKYGMIKVADNPIQKSEDRLEINARLRRDIDQNLQISALFDLKTHLHDIYQLDKQGRRVKLTGNFFAPAFIHLGSGIDISTNDNKFNIFYSPLNSKFTIVTNDLLAPQFLKGDQESNFRHELGSLLRLELKKTLAENISIHSHGTFFTNHLEDFGVFDVELEGKLKFKVNKFFNVNLLAHFVYDEDILFDVSDDEADIEQLPRAQFREILNLGISHNL